MHMQDLFRQLLTLYQSKKKTQRKKKLNTILDIRILEFIIINSQQIHLRFETPSKINK